MLYGLFTECIRAMNPEDLGKVLSAMPGLKGRTLRSYQRADKSSNKQICIFAQLAIINILNMHALSLIGAEGKTKTVHIFAI